MLVYKFIELFMLLYERYTFPTKGDVIDISECRAYNGGGPRWIEGRFICVSHIEKTEFGRILKIYSFEHGVIDVQVDALKDAKIVVKVSES